MDKKYNISLIIGIILIIIVNIIYNNKKKLTTQLYVTNTYLYVVLSIMLTSLTLLIMETLKIDTDNNKYTLSRLFGSFILGIIIIFALRLTDRSNILTRHILYGLFAIVMGIMIYPTYQYSIDTGTLYTTITSVILTTIGLTLITNMYPVESFDKWEYVLSAGLLGLIIFESIDLIFTSDTIISGGRSKLYAGIGVALFSGYIMYDTSRIYKNGQIAVDCTLNNITNPNNNLICSDYPNSSLNLYLDILNMFLNINNLQNY